MFSNKPAQATLRGDGLNTPHVLHIQIPRSGGGYDKADVKADPLIIAAFRAAKEGGTVPSLAGTGTPYVILSRDAAGRFHFPVVNLPF